jgi:hypothetical protein
MTDRLNLTRALESSGMQSAAAERIATEIYDAIHDNVATKQDLERIEAALKADLFRIEATLKGEIALVLFANIFAGIGPLERLSFCTALQFGTWRQGMPARRPQAAKLRRRPFLHDRPRSRRRAPPISGCHKPGMPTNQCSAK